MARWSGDIDDSLGARPGLRSTGNRAAPAVPPRWVAPPVLTPVSGRDGQARVALEGRDHVVAGPADLHDCRAVGGDVVAGRELHRPRAALQVLVRREP